MRATVINLAAKFALLGLSLVIANSYALTIATGPVAGVYYPTGGALCRVLNESPTLNQTPCKVQTSRGSLANLHALQKGEADLALVQADVLFHARHGSGPFTQVGADQQLRSLFAVHNESLTLLASSQSDIDELSDLVGKRVYLGHANSGEQLTSVALLEALGWSAKQFVQPLAKANPQPLEGLCDGRLDAAFLVIGHPSLVVGDLTSRCHARLITIEGDEVAQLVANSHYYQPYRIPAQLYPGQENAINTFAMVAELVAKASLPDPIVRHVRDTLRQQFKPFTRRHPALSKLTEQQLEKPTELPRHQALMQMPPPLPRR